jgi:hypothetical protein
MWPSHKSDIPAKAGVTELLIDKVPAGNRGYSGLLPVHPALSILCGTAYDHLQQP